MLAIRDIMNKIVISVRPEATLMDAVKVLTKHHISAAPVVTSDGEVIGFIADEHLMDVLFDRGARHAPVTGFMSDDVHIVNADDPVSTAASLFAMYGVRRLPVMDGGRFVGVVTRRDLLVHFLRNPEPLREPLFDLIPTLGEIG